MKTVLTLGVVLLLASCSGSREIHLAAKKQLGGYYKRGVTEQCANFVGHCANAAGHKPPANPAKAVNWLKWGKPVPYALKQPGDVIIVWRNSPRSGDGHIMIYAGDGKAIHRSTSSKPIEYIEVDRYRHKVLGVRRAR